MRYNLKVNGKPVGVDAESGAPLLWVLREHLQLAGPKFGCGLGQCGSCAVLLGNRVVRSCVTPVSTVGTAEITTLEGLGTPERPHPIQQAFIDEQAAQCGYCINGMIMQAAGLLATNPHPTEPQVRQALAANLCKCGTHVRILRAVMRVAGRTA